MASPHGSEFHGFDGSDPARTDSPGLDRTVVQQKSHIAHEDNVHTEAQDGPDGHGHEPNLTQRESAIVQRLDELHLQLVSAASESESGSTSPNTPVQSEPDTAVPPIVTVTAVPPIVSTHSGASSSNGVYEQFPVQSSSSRHTYVPPPPCTYVPASIAHVHTTASSSWPAASMGVYTHSSSLPISHAHISTHVTQRPVNHDPDYTARLPQSVPQSSRSHREMPYPGYGASYAAALPQSNGVPGPAAMVRRLEHRRLLDLPTFTGMPEDWPKFQQAFHNSTRAYGYDDVENLLRLQKSLSGEAERAVESLLIHPAHVGNVMETLRDTFGHPDLLIRSQIDRVRRLSPVHETNLEQLVPLANVVRNVATYLDEPTTQHHLANPMLLEELASKLPISRRVDWAAVATQVRPYATVMDFANWLCGVARIVRLAIPSSTTVKLTTSQTITGGRSVAKPQVPKRVLLNAANVTEVEERAKCSYCGKEHETARCFSFKRLSPTERWRVVTEGAWCYSCLGEGHILPSCVSKQRCVVTGCEQWHHELLHDRGGSHLQPNSGPNQSKPQSAAGNKERRRSSKRPTPSPIATVTTSSASQPTTAQPTEGRSNGVQEARICTVQEKTSNNTLLFRVMPIILRANGRELKTFALFDEGSSVSLIDDSLVEELGIDGPVADLSMKWFGKQTTVLRSRKLTLQISGQSRPESEYTMRVRTIRHLSLPKQTVDPDALYDCNPHLRDVPLESFHNAVPLVLIGLDNHHLGIPREVKASADDDGLVAVRSKLGWTVYGSDGPAHLPNAMVLMVDGERDEEYELLNEMVRSYITSEDFSVQTPLAIIESDDVIRARSILQRTTRRVGERYETGLLWRQDDANLPPSYDMALSRLRNVEARMQRDPRFAEQYAAQINSYLAKGYARKVEDDELQRDDGRVWYLPHFAVVNPNKPDKFRLVFDAAAKVRGVSLNAALLPGPDDNMPLTRLLFQFRLGEIGVCADIAEMFHQVRIRAEDQAAQRFLWRGGDSAAKPDVYTMAVMTFGATCSPAAAQHVKNANADEYRNEFPDAVEAIRQRHYVDDFVASFATPDEAARVSNEVVEVHRRGGFVLRGFVSNSRAVLEALGVSTGPGEQVDLEPESTFQKILGMTWNTADDTFRFRTRFSRVPQGVLDGTKRPTKRIILSTCMSVFDPYGLLANFMLPPKLMVQDLYRMGLDWDESAPDEIWKRWEAWRVEIERTHLLRVPRCPFYNVKAITDLQLHIYADASEAAFASVAFWRITRGNETELSFVTGKVKVAPTPIQSMPRLELNAAVLATRLLGEIRKSHADVQINKFVMWTDSETVLKWIRSDQRKYKQYVGFRIAEIAKSTPASMWRWVPTSLNVADDGTRVRNPPVFDPDGRWLWGPAWLREPEESWPKQRDAATSTEPCPEEVRSKYVGVIIVRPLVDYTRFSSLHRPCRSVAWILRFCHNARSSRRKMLRTQGELSSTKVDDGLKWLCRMAQKEIYEREYKTLQRRKPLDRTSSIFVLNPYLDGDNLIRLYGRTDAADDDCIPQDARRPISVGGANLTTVPDPADIQSLMHREQWVQSREKSRQFWPANRYDKGIVCDNGQLRSRWICGRVVETSLGADGFIRSAKVRTTDKEYWRPTTKLAVLDVSPPQRESTYGARDVATYR